MPRRVLHARWILPFVAVVAAFALWRNERGPHWRELRPGVEFTTHRGRTVLPARLRRRSRCCAWTRGARGCGRYYDRQRARRACSPCSSGRSCTGALAVFNAGQYYPDFRYMGVLVCGGDTVSAQPHPGFQAALVADSGRAHVLDLARTPLSGVPRWSDVAQSFMLFDRAGGVRVRRSGRRSPTAPWWARTSAAGSWCA